MIFFILYYYSKDFRSFYRDTKKSRVRTIRKLLTTKLYNKFAPLTKLGMSMNSEFWLYYGLAYTYA